MKIKTLLIPLAFPVMLVSCEKDIKETTISGTVYEANSTTPVANATVKYAWIERHTINTIYHVIDSTRTDNNGGYNLKVQSAHGDVLVYAEKPEYFGMEYTLDENNVTAGESNHRNLYIIPYAWARINYDQSDPNHGVTINRPPGTDHIFGFALASDTTVYSRILGNGVPKTELSIFYNISGQQVNHEYRAVQTGSHDTTDVNIYF